MLQYLPIAPFAVALLLVACTGGNDPVAENAVAPPDELLGDASATGLATPANAATAEAVQQAALPPARDGLAWVYRTQDRAALFGPPGAEPAFSITCRSDGGRKVIEFARLVPAPAGSTGTLSFTGNGAAASLPASGTALRNGTETHWRAIAEPGDMARDVAKTFQGPGSVHVGVGGAPALVVPASGPPGRVFRDCSVA